MSDVSASDVIDSLLRSVALSDGFSLHVVLCPTPLEGRAIVDGLRAGLPGGATHFDPYGAPRSLDAPLTPDEIAHATVAPLDAAALHHDVSIIDLSRIMPADHFALGRSTHWENAFRQLNVQRSECFLSLRCLVLLLPALRPWTYSLEQAFTQGAPDLWSVRTQSFLTRVMDRPKAVPRIGALRKRFREAIDLLAHLAAVPQERIEKLTEHCETDAWTAALAELEACDNTGTSAVEALTLCRLTARAALAGDAALAQDVAEAVDRWRAMPGGVTFAESALHLEFDDAFVRLGASLLFDLGKAAGAVAAMNEAADRALGRWAGVGGHASRAVAPVLAGEVNAHSGEAADSWGYAALATMVLRFVIAQDHEGGHLGEYPSDPTVLADLVDRTAALCALHGDEGRGASLFAAHAELAAARTRRD